MYTIGIDIGGTNLKAGLVDEQEGLVTTASMPLQWVSPEKLVEDLLDLSDGLLRRQGIDRGAVSAIGIGVPGVVDHAAGTIVKTTNIPIRNLPVAELIGRGWHVPVHLGNDADCAAWGEYCHFARRMGGSTGAATAAPERAGTSLSSPAASCAPAAAVAAGSGMPRRPPWCGRQRRPWRLIPVPSCGS